MKRLLVVVVIALGGFAAALMAFADAARRDCVVEATRDPSYSVQFEQSPVAEHARTPVLLVDRDGEPVVGAWVCVNVQSTVTPARQVSAEGMELTAGRYAVPLEIPTGGRWEGRALVEEKGMSRPVAVPVAFDAAGRNQTLASPQVAKRGPHQPSSSEAVGPH